LASRWLCTPEVDEGLWEIAGEALTVLRIVELVECRDAGSQLVAGLAALVSLEGRQTGEVAAGAFQRRRERVVAASPFVECRGDVELGRGQLGENTWKDGSPSLFLPLRTLVSAHRSSSAEPGVLTAIVSSVRSQTSTSRYASVTFGWRPQ
jgi:hypothetical protein